MTARTRTICRHHTYLFARRRNTFLVRTSQCTIHTALHFSNVGTPHWLKVKRNLCHAFLCTNCHLVRHVIVERSVCPSPSGVTYMLCVQNFSDLNLVRWQWTKSLVPPLTGVECLAAWPIRPQTQVMSPTSTATWSRSTRRSISVTVTEVSSAATTPPSSQLPKIQKILRIREHPAAASKPQQAEFPQC